MLSGILVFNQKGENLIFRAFRSDCRPRLADIFRIQVISNPQVRSPILTLGSTTFSHVKHENIYLVAVTKSNANAALVFEFLYRLIALGKSYFGKFDEEAVKNNFVLIYELLDEILDFGYPQNTETDTLKMYITTEGVKSAIVNSPTDSSRITQQATGALSWRRSDIKYRKNEAFVDVIEDVNLLMSATGTVLRADVNGQIVMRAYLSGTPECKFGLNDRLLLDTGESSGGNGSRGGGLQGGGKATRAAAGSVTLEDCQFHQCVKLGRFDADRIISFVPPDGEFELMRYRATENVNLPFKVHPIVREIGTTKVEYSVAIKANYSAKLFASNVVVRIPTPLNTAKTVERTSQGRARYEPEQNNIVWKIPRFTGQSEFVLNAEATLTSMTHQKAWSRPPLSLSFSILMFTSSGLLVRYLKVFEKGNYSSVKWVRYMTRAGSYEIRTCQLIILPGQLTWFVTGCSSGLGEALVRAILSKGDKVIATARASNGTSGAQRLAALEKAGAAVLELDITASQAELNEKANEAWSIYGQVDILVNNAGYIEAAVVEEMDEDLFVKSLRTNVHGPLDLTRAFLPFIRARASGTILFSGTLGVYHGAPGASPYTASKGLLDALVPNLALEIASFGLRTSILVFGNFRTNIMAPGNIQHRAPNLVPEYTGLNSLVRQGCAALNGNQPGDPGKACGLIVEAVRGEGRCSGKELPLRLPIGSDAFQCLRDNAAEKKRVCDEWEGITSETNVD